MQTLIRFGILTLLIALLTPVLKAQQEPQFTQYMFYNMNFNPGFAGNNNAICINGADRMQWTGFGEGAPETFFITAHAPIRILRGGVSLSIVQDKIGSMKDIVVRLGYAYQKRIGFGKLGIGAQVAFDNRTLNFGDLEPVVDDPLIGQLGDESDMLIDFSLGLFYSVPGSYYVGLSGVNLLSNKGAVLSEGGGSEMRYQLDRTLYLTAGYEYVFPGNPAFEFLPSLLLKSNLSSFQMDISALLRFKDLVWGGLSYRLMYPDAIAVILGLQYKDFKIGYSYDINISGLALPVGGGTHEIMLGYCFKLEIEKGRKSYKNTRFL